MSGSRDDNNLIELLTAFADGELDAAQTLAMWTYLAEHPDRHAALRWLQEQQQLTLAARQISERAAPSDLRERITASVRPTLESKRPRARKSAWGRRIGYPLAAAAGLAIGITATVFMARSAPPAEVLPARLIAAVGRVHAHCSRLPEALHDATLEATDATIATAMKTSLGSGSATPDLLPAGFRFVGADHCLGTRAQTVHLLYRSTDASQAAVSVFVQADAGKFSGLDSGRVYRVSSPTSPFPTLTWKSGSIIYVLVADDDKTQAVVLQTMRPTRPEEILTVASR